MYNGGSQYSSSCRFIYKWHVRIKGGGAPRRLENYKNIEFLSNTGPDPLKITKLPSQHSMLGHHRPASETPFQWRFASGPLMTRSLDPSSPHQTK